MWHLVYGVWQDVGPSDPGTDGVDSDAVVAERRGSYAARPADYAVLGGCVGW